MIVVLVPLYDSPRDMGYESSDGTYHAPVSCTTVGRGQSECRMNWSKGALLTIDEMGLKTTPRSQVI